MHYSRPPAYIHVRAKQPYTEAVLTLHAPALLTFRSERANRLRVAIIEYIARRTKEGVTLEKLSTAEDGISISPVPIRHDLRRHSAGFEFGYSGSGPAQTALAILADCVGDEKAEELYQEFKRTFLAVHDGNELRISQSAIELWVASKYPITQDAADQFVSVR